MRIDRLKKPLVKIFGKLHQYRYILLGAIIISLYVYAVGIINSELSPERDQAAYDKTRQSIERVQFNEEAVKTIVRLRELKVDVDAIFAPGRTNPFE